MPQFLGLFADRRSVARFQNDPRGLVAGLLVPDPEGGWALRDGTGSLSLEAPWVQAWGLTGPTWLALRFETDSDPVPVFSQPVATDALWLNKQNQYDALRHRFLVIQKIKRFFLNRDFLEVDSPVAVLNPGTEPFLDTFPVGPLWLRTSPELHMKQLLGLGFDNLFQIGACFRKGDIGRWHTEEFLMLEWYRSFADLDAIAQDIEDLLCELAEDAQDPAYFRQAPERVTCAELFKRHLGISLIDHCTVAPLRQSLAERGISTLPEDDWDTLFFLAFLNFIEPHLGNERPTLVTHYPASQAALAKLAPVQPGQMPSCLRMELYLRQGLELANGFYELTDPQEQRARALADNQHRAVLGKPQYPLDEDFLAALQRGLPPCAGIALGVERLIASLLGAHSLAAVSPFSRPSDLR